jgi:hypothetical protein
MIVAPVVRAVVREVESLPETARGAGGFGSTGLVILCLALASSNACKKKETPEPPPVVAAPEPLADAGAPSKPVPSKPKEEVRGPCLPGMALANDGTITVCMDRYEFPGFGQMPQADLTQDEAQAKCADLGKRLCTEEEWRAGCQGPSNSTFPYGDSYQGTVCNTSLGKAMPVSESGSFPECVSASGVYDMAGNVAEWIATSGHSMGGSAADGDDGRCSFKVKRARAKDTDLGFRCCSEPRVGR